MDKITSIFGANVFNDEVMRSMLPDDIYKSLRNTMDNGIPLQEDVAKVVANAMKDWAIQKGATHYTHWFQPMTGITAEKHDSFLTPTKDGKCIMEFSGKELVKGEPDASSFPSGGIRATFEARGYTSWDPTSYAFIKDGSLCIPTAFCSYSGEALDKKTPLLRSMEAINTQALRVLKLFKNNEGVKRVISTVGPEQEYFLIDKNIFNKRKDLVYTGRTLFGAKPPKGQELDDHYFGSLKPRVSAFMKELDEELWKLGIYAKTKHNEVAPAQHELAPVFTTTNVATDHNQLTMEIMKTVARKHDLACILHEKPFANLNGSGKHNNWSLSTDTGVNLLEPGKSPYENAQFILFLVAVIKAVDENQDLLRISVASAGNDHRLGSNEAPPAIISIFLGEELEEILESIETGNKYKAKEKSRMELGVTTLPKFTRDSTDRNRTSPFAFTGNKFEFRMPGSTLSVAGPNIVINTIVAESLRQFADILEKAENFDEELNKLVVSTYKKHKRIIYNGNNYSKEWVEEAEKRGLLNLVSSADSIPLFTSKKNVELFARHKVFSEKEIISRTEILLENYCKTINIEALTMNRIVKKDIFPAVNLYIRETGKNVESKKALSAELNTSVEEKIITRLNELNMKLINDVYKLEKTLKKAEEITDYKKKATFFRNQVYTAMEKMRSYADEMELFVGRNYWPFPTYGDLLSSVN